VSKPYRPSCGTEGADFMAEWCDRCAREKPTREGLAEDGCAILSDTFMYEKADPRYPKEWVEDENGPRCTAFEAEK
jgi:hypothetical protein